jgi:hypothetical protein
MPCDTRTERQAVITAVAPLPGTVEFTGASGAPVLVDAGGSTFVDGTTGRAAPPAETAAAALRPELPQGTEAAITVQETAPSRPDPALPEFSVTVTF